MVKMKSKIKFRIAYVRIEDSPIVIMKLHRVLKLNTA